MRADDPGTPRPFGLWALLILSIFAWAPATYPGYWQSLEGFTPVLNAPFQQPIADVGTVPDLWRGMGQATFTLTRPLVLLGVEPVFAVRTLFILMILGGGLGIYAWLRPWYGDPGAGLAGALYLLSPILLDTVYGRGSLADAHILALLPITLAGLSLYRRTRSPAAIGGAVLAILWMWRTQAGLALFATILLLLYSLWVERDRLLLIGVAVSGVAGLLSLIPLRDVRAEPTFIFGEHFLNPGQLFDGAPALLRDGGWSLDYPMTVGIGAILLLTLSIWAFARGYRTRLVSLERTLFVFSLILIGIVLVMSTSLSAFIWRLSGAQALVTFPWQLWLLALPFASAIGGALLRMAPGLERRTLWSALLLLLLIASIPSLRPAFTLYTPSQTPLALFGDPPILLLLDAELRPVANGESDEAAIDLEATWQVVGKPDFDYNLFFQALSADEETDGFEVVSQLDAQPLDDYPASQWRPGEILSDTYRLELTEPAAELRYYLGFYNWSTADRLRIAGAEDDKVILYAD